MPRTKFVVTSTPPKTFRTEKVRGMFDVQEKEISKEFDVDIPIEEMDWNVGLIVGASGSGKTTIAKRCFPNYEFFEGYSWASECFLDDFDSSLLPTQIVEALTKVGFSSPPDWLRPFSVLSNGQKMRAELARLILECNKPVIYDEFTSVVDRQVAQVGSAAIQKFIRKSGKQFIAVSCHYDIEEWLEPDWVYDADVGEFRRGLLRRPSIEVGVRKASQAEWKLFKDFHYLSNKHNNAADKYIAEIRGVPVAWCSVLHFPHPKIKNFKRIHRLVVRPDYQGIGVGGRLLDTVAGMYPNSRVRIITSSPALLHGLQKNKKWVMVDAPKRKMKGQTQYGHLHLSSSAKRLTATFEFRKQASLPS